MADLEKELELDLENLDVGDVAVSIGANLESHLLMSAFVVCSWSQVAYIANYGHRSDSSLGTHDFATKTPGQSHSSRS